MDDVMSKNYWLEGTHVFARIRRAAPRAPVTPAQAAVIAFSCEGQSVQVDTGRRQITIEGETHPARIEGGRAVYPARALRPGETLRRIPLGGGQAEAFANGRWQLLGSCNRM